MRLHRFPALLSTVLLTVSVSVSAQNRAVAVTIDDLPFVSGDESRSMQPIDAKWAAASNHELLMGLARHHVPVTGLVIQKGVGNLGATAGTAILKEWVQRGFDLGNHTYSHPNFDDLTVEQFEDEIVHGEVSLDSWRS